MTDATQQGASTDEKIDTENLKVDENNLPPRLRAMASIKVDRDDDEPSAVDQQLSAQLEAEPPKATDPKPEPAAAPKALTDGLDKMLVTVKIDGVERQVTVEEMQRTYQKAGAADKRLEEATRLLREAQAREQQSPPVGVAQSGTQGDSANVPDGGDEEGKQFLSALFEGDESKALEAFKKATGGRHQPIQSESDLIAKLTPAIKQQLLQESALEKFEKDFADVVADPYLDQVAAEFIRAEMDGGKSFIESLEIGGNKTRDWIASKIPKTDPAPKPTMNRDAKLERKASIDQIPALNKAASTTVEQPKSASEVIVAMRKARGLD